MLAVRHGLNTGADHLGDKRRGVDRERQCQCRQLRDHDESAAEVKAAQRRHVPVRSGAEAQMRHRREQHEHGESGGPGAAQLAGLELIFAMIAEQRIAAGGGQCQRNDKGTGAWRILRPGHIESAVADEGDIERA